MYGNPFEIGQKVSGDFPVGRQGMQILGDFSDIELKWHKIGNIEVLTLDEILYQIIKATKNPYPSIRIFYETALWGVIFETGNYIDLGHTWIVQGITKGYA